MKDPEKKITPVEKYNTNSETTYIPLITGPDSEILREMLFPDGTVELLVKPNVKELEQSHLYSLARQACGTVVTHARLALYWHNTSEDESIPQGREDRYQLALKEYKALETIRSKLQQQTTPPQCLIPQDIPPSLFSPLRGITSIRYFGISTYDPNLVIFIAYTSSGPVCINVPLNQTRI